MFKINQFIVAVEISFKIHRKIIIIYKLGAML